MKYQTGIQQTVLDIIVKSKEMNLEYVTKKQIMDEVIRIYGDFPNPESRIGQALHMLMKDMVYQKKKIKLVYDKKGKRVGYTIVDDKWVFEKDKEE
jgi:hypothetical protein